MTRLRRRALALALTAVVLLVLLCLSAGLIEHRCHDPLSPDPNCPACLIANTPGGLVSAAPCLPVEPPASLEKTAALAEAPIHQVSLPRLLHPRAPPEA